MNELTLNGQTVCFAEGETLLDIASRQGLEIPTLCHDPAFRTRGCVSLLSGGSFRRTVDDTGLCAHGPSWYGGDDRE